MKAMLLARYVCRPSWLQMPSPGPRCPTAKPGLLVFSTIVPSPAKDRYDGKAGPFGALVLQSIWVTSTSQVPSTVLPLNSLSQAGDFALALVLHSATKIAAPVSPSRQVRRNSFQTLAFIFDLSCGAGKSSGLGCGASRAYTLADASRMSLGWV